MAKNWYPVINTEACIECGKCVKQCAQGVYDKSSLQKPVIVYTDGCIDECHGCGNLCPTGSITYSSDNTGWTPPNKKPSSESACGCNCSCDEVKDNEKDAAKTINIDFLYLDLITCERCQATDTSLKEALDVLSGVFDTLRYTVKINKVNITSRELAKQYRFISSPTIRVNGIDINAEIKENDCADCGSLCGGSVDCRVFTYEGKDYEQPPATMIIDGILKAIYGQKPTKEEPYALSDNLNKFFDGVYANDNKSCGCGDSECSSNEPVAVAGLTVKNLLIEWRHLDVEGEMSARSYDTGENLAAEVKRLNKALNPQGIEVKYIEKKLDESQLSISNTLLFNNIPLEDILNIEVSQNYCGSCTDLLGKATNCGTIIFDGNEYEAIPAKAIRLAAYKVLRLGPNTSENTGCCTGEKDCGCEDIQSNNESTNKQSIKTMTIYEPAMCCPTGLCGVSIDPELLRLSTVLVALEKNGVKIDRYNLTSFPQEFIKNAEINKLINSGSVDALPATVVDGKIVKTKVYPTNGEIIMWLNIPEYYLVEKSDNSGGCCSVKTGCC
jgi:NAD-dependent dihydropyrimidine dehydrogenase PreA subunit